MKPKKPKACTVEMIDPEAPEYGLLKELIAVHHPHLADMEINLAWKRDWKEDKDGHLTLGQARKCGEVDRAVHGLDFIILLNAEVWCSEQFTDLQRRALLDHELCHCQIALDENGDPKLDEKGRQVGRMRGHDVEDFTEIVGRYGLWKPDLRKFVESAQAARPGQLELFKEDDGGVEMTLTTSTAKGTQSVTLTKERIAAVKRMAHSNPFDT